MFLKSSSHCSAALLLLACLPLTTVAADGVQWRHNLDAAKLEAVQSNRLVLLHFYTKSCGPCRVLDKQTFSQPRVAANIEQNYVPVKVDADASPALRGAFRIERVPTDVVITPQGNEVAKFGSSMDASEYLDRLAQVAIHFRQKSENGQQTPLAPAHSAYANLNVARPPASPQATQTQPGMTNNPYFQTQAVAHDATPAPTNTASTNTAPQQVARTGPQVPANAMPQSYRNPYVAAAMAQPQTPPATTQATPRYPAQPVATVAPPTSRTVPASAAQVTPAASTPAAQIATSQTAATPQQDAASILPTEQDISPTPADTALATAGNRQAGAPGSTPLGFDGCCPVTLKFASKWVRGNPAIGLEHRGRIYLFTGEKERQQFLANPDSYSPVFSGLDPVLMMDQNASVAGSRKFGYKYRGAFYLFSSKATMERFAANPDDYSARVRQAMTRLDSLNSGGVIRR